MNGYRKTVAVILISFTIGCSGIHPNRHLIDKKKDLVFVLHGLGSTKAAMWFLGERIEQAGFSVEYIGYQSFYNTPEEVLENVAGQISRFLLENNRTLHFVGHSLGGLMIRAYLDSRNVENLGKVVLIGSPNKGTVFVDQFKDRWWMGLLGPLPLSLGTDENSFPNSIGRPYYPVGIIAGVSDWVLNDKILPGKDDGIVPLESAKVEGMTDMTVVSSGHNMMLYDQKVADQTIEFLRQGRFNSQSE